MQKTARRVVLGLEVRYPGVCSLPHPASLVEPPVIQTGLPPSVTPGSVQVCSVSLCHCAQWPWSRPPTCRDQGSDKQSLVMPGTPQAALPRSVCVMDEAVREGNAWPSDGLAGQLGDTSGKKHLLCSRHFAGRVHNPFIYCLEQPRFTEGETEAREHREQAGVRPGSIGALPASEEAGL